MPDETHTAAYGKRLDAHATAPGRRLAVAMIALSGLLSGCGEWPPKQDEISRHIERESEALARLESLMVENDFSRIRETIVPGQVQVTYAGSEKGAPDQLLEGKHDWADLLTKARVIFVERREGGFWFGAGDVEQVTFAYVHDADAPERYPRCKPEFERYECGQCVAEVNEEWWIWYWWYPEGLEPEAYRACESRSGAQPLGAGD